MFASRVTPEPRDYGHEGVTSQALMLTPPVHGTMLHAPPLQSADVVHDVGPCTHDDE